MEYRRHRGKRDWIFALNEFIFPEPTHDEENFKLSYVINAKNKINRANKAMEHIGTGQG